MVTLVLLNENRVANVIARVPQGEARREQTLRDLIFEAPSILPMGEIEPGIGAVVPVAIELNLPGAGFIDVLLVSEHGRLIIVECKLWRNPQARREVVGQVIDYARALSLTPYEQLQGAISARLDRPGNVLFELAREAGSTMTEAAFVDRVTRDLAAGRFLLMIVGDGITEGAQRLGAYLSEQPGLAFDFALVEMAEYRFFDTTTQAERQIMQPRVLARTAIIERFVIRNDVPGTLLVALDESGSDTGAAKPVGEVALTWRAFVDRFARDTLFDDPGQPPARWGGINWMKLTLPGPASMTLWRSSQTANMGVQLSYRDPEGFRLFDALHEDREDIAAEFAAHDLEPPVWEASETMRSLSLTTSAELPWDGASEDRQMTWMGQAANQMVNSLRPRLTRLLETA